DAVDQSELLRLLRGDGARGVEQVHGQRPGDQARQHHRAEVRAHAALGLGEADRGLLDGDADVAGEYDLAAAGDRVAVDGGDDRLVGLEDHLEQRAVLAGHRGVHLAAGAGDVVHLLHVAAGAESLVTGTGDDDRPHIGVVAGLDERLDELLHGVPAHGVAAVRAVDGDPGDPVGHLVEDLVLGTGGQSVAHRSAPISMTPAASSWSMRAWSSPSSASTAEVSAPSSGGASLRSRYSPSKVTGVLTTVTSPRRSCFM